jgi:hypothetical protein
LSAAIEDSQQVRNVIAHAMKLFPGTPPMHEDAVPTLVIDSDGNSILIPVGEWRRAGALQLFVRRRWSPRYGDPALEIFVRRRELVEALAHGIPLESLQPKDASQGEVPTRGKRTDQRRGKVPGDYWEHLLSLFKHWRDYTPGAFKLAGSQKSVRRLARDVRTAWCNRARPLPQSPLPLPSLPHSDSELRNAVAKALQKLVDESAPQ